MRGRTASRVRIEAEVKALRTKLASKVKANAQLEASIPLPAEETDSSTISTQPLAEQRNAPSKKLSGDISSMVEEIKKKAAAEVQSLWDAPVADEPEVSGPTSSYPPYRASVDAPRTRTGTTNDMFQYVKKYKAGGGSHLFVA